MLLSLCSIRSLPKFPFIIVIQPALPNDAIGNRPGSGMHIVEASALSFNGSNEL